MLDDGAAEPAGEDAREFGAPLIGAHAVRVTPGVRFDVVVFVHGHHGDPAKRRAKDSSQVGCISIGRRLR